MELLCNLERSFFNTSGWLFGFIEVVIFLAVIFLTYKVVVKVVKTSKNLLHKILKTILALFGSFLVFLILTIINITIIVFNFPGDHPPSAGYHVLNAAIKNTCFLDPERKHCPRSVSDLVSIEPENFSKLTKDAHLVYRYYPDSNQYTLIIRNKNIWRNNYRVAIFDPRLTTAKNYGSGLHFIDAKVSN